MKKKNSLSPHSYSTIPKTPSKSASIYSKNSLRSTTSNSKTISKVTNSPNNAIECILSNKLKISFDDIAGNDYAKEIINETFVLPLIAPKVFKGKARPWQSILLYGVL